MFALFLLTIVVAFGSLTLFLEVRAQRLQASQVEKVAEQQAPVPPIPPISQGQDGHIPTPAVAVPIFSALPTAGPTLLPTVTPTPTAMPTTRPTATPNPTLTPEPWLRSDQRSMELKEYMLGLVNNIREDEGLPPVLLGNNIAAQLHAERSLKDCISGHWGTDGLKPYMRYSLAGGIQANAENVFGLHHCIQS